MRVPDAFDGALAGLAAGFLAAGFAAGFLAFGDLALAAGFLALGEAAFFGLFFGAALGLAGDFLGAACAGARRRRRDGDTRTLGFAGDFLATVFFLAGDLAFEAGFAGDFLAALGDLRSARSAQTPSTSSRRTPPSRLAFAAGLAALGDLAAGLGLFLGVAFLGAGLLVNAS